MDCVHWQSSVEAFEPAEGYGATALPVAPSRNWRGAAALKLAVLTLAVVAVLAVSGVFTSSDKEVVLGDSSMKTIDTLLAHIDKITHDAKAGHKKDKSAKDKISQNSEDDEVVPFSIHPPLPAPHNIFYPSPGHIEILSGAVQKLVALLGPSSTSSIVDIIQYYTILYYT